MQGLGFKGIFFRRNRGDGRGDSDKQDGIDLDGGELYGPGRGFVQDRPPHRFRCMGSGKVRHTHAHDNQEQRDGKGYEAKVATISCKHTHGVKVADFPDQYKPLRGSSRLPRPIESLFWWRRRSSVIGRKCMFVVIVPVARL